MYVKKNTPVAKLLCFSVGHCSFSEAIIKQIHTLIIMDRLEDCGFYHRIPVRIMCAYHTLPALVMVPNLMEEYIKGFEVSKLHPTEKSSTVPPEV